MVRLSSPWAVIDQKILDKVSGLLPLSEKSFILTVGPDSVRFARYDDEWRVVSFKGLDGCGYVGSCMNGRRVEKILKNILADRAPKPKQLSLFNLGE